MNRINQPQIVTPSINSLPVVESSRMKNGIELYTIDVGNTDIIRIDFMFMGGAWMQKHPLQASLAVGNIKDGTQKHAPYEVNEILDTYGANFSYMVTKTFSALTVTFLRKHIDKVMAISSEILKQPLYDYNFLQIKIQQLWTNYEIQSQQVRTQSEQQFYKSLFGNSHPLASFPSQEHFQNVEESLLWDYYNKFIGSKNCRIFISGFVDSYVLDIVNNLFGYDNWGGNLIADNITELMYINEMLPHISDDTIVKYNMPQKTVQSNVFSGKIWERLSGRKKAAMLITNTLFGGFFGSRLMKNIREEKGLTYGINSYVVSTHLYNVFCITTDTTNDAVDAVINEIKREMSSLSTKKVSEEELNIVKNYFAGKICRTYESNLSYVNQIMRKLSIGECIDEIMAIQKYIKDLNPDDIMDFANDYLTLEHFLWSVAG